MCCSCSSLIRWGVGSQPQLMQAIMQHFLRLLPSLDLECDEQPVPLLLEGI
jgi:hypothetical protein